MRKVVKKALAGRLDLPWKQPHASFLQNGVLRELALHVSRGRCFSIGQQLRTLALKIGLAAARRLQ